MRTDKIGPDLLKAPVMHNLGSLIQLSWGFSPGLSLHLMPIVAAYLKRQFRLPRHFIFNTLRWYTRWQGPLTQSGNVSKYSIEFLLQRQTAHLFLIYIIIMLCIAKETLNLRSDVQTRHVRSVRIQSYLFYKRTPL